MSPIKNPKKPESFGQAFQELEQITTELEGDSLDLDAAIEKFERGLGLAQQLKAKLTAVEQRVEKIRKKFDTLELPESEEAAEDQG